MPSNNTFGWFFSTLLAMFALYSYFQGLKISSIAAATGSIIFLTTTFFVPHLLTKLNIIWYEFGILLGKIISPIVLCAMFFLLITPVALVIRLFGRDELRIKKSHISSYWVDRLPPGPSSESFKNQF